MMGSKTRGAQIKAVADQVTSAVKSAGGLVVAALVTAAVALVVSAVALVVALKARPLLKADLTRA